MGAMHASPFVISAPAPHLFTVALLSAMAGTSTAGCGASTPCDTASSAQSSGASTPVTHGEVADDPAALPGDGTPTNSTAPSRFDARLSLYEYPFEVHVRAFEAQGQALEMAYMDLHPEGDANGRTVLLLHGKNFSGAYWAPVARSLAAQGFRVVMPDQIGFGKSSKPVDFQYSFAALAAHTRALIEQLGIERVAVVGHSMGGMLATRYALLYGAHVQQLVLMNPIGLEDWAALGVPYRSIDAQVEADLGATADGVRAYMRASYYDGAWTDAYEEVAAIQIGWTTSPDREVLARVSARTYDMIFTQPVVHEFPRLAVPTLLVIGTRDRTALGKDRVDETLRAQLGQYQQLGRDAQSAIEGAELVEFEGIGHLPQVEAFDRTMTSLHAFLAAD